MKPFVIAERAGWMVASAVAEGVTKKKKRNFKKRKIAAMGRERKRKSQETGLCCGTEGMCTDAESSTWGVLETVQIP